MLSLEKDFDMTQDNNGNIKSGFLERLVVGFLAATSNIPQTPIRHGLEENESIPAPTQAKKQIHKAF